MWSFFNLFVLTCFMHFVFGFEISKLSTPPVNTAVAPFWDNNTQSLYFTNILTTGMQSSIFRYSFTDAILYSAYIEGVQSPSFIIPVNRKCEKCNKCDEQIFAVGIEREVLLIKWNGKSTKAKIIKRLFGIESDNPEKRTNYGRTDSRGRFYGGSLTRTFCEASPTSSFYRYTKSKGVHRLFGHVSSTTGIAFNEKTRKLYHLDSCTLLITEFNWDPETGDICNGRVVFEFPLNSTPINSHFPIGLTIDTHGMLYFAAYSGTIWKIDPRSSKVIAMINLPVAGAAGLAFGGPMLDILFVICESSILDVISAKFVQQIANASALYMITGLDSTGTKFAPLNIE